MPYNSIAALISTLMAGVDLNHEVEVEEGMETHMRTTLCLRPVQSQSTNKRSIKITELARLRKAPGCVPTRRSP